MPNNEINISFAIKKIAITNFYVDEDAYNKDNLEMEISLTQNTTFEPEPDLANITLTFLYKYRGGKESIASISVLNTFHIIGLKNFLQEDNTKTTLPREVLTNLLGLSVSHTRALFAHSISSTKYKEGISLFIVDPSILVDALYPFIKQENKPDIVKV